MAATLMILRASDLLDTVTRTATGDRDRHRLSTSLYNVAATVISIPGGSHGDRRGMVRVFAAGVGCFAVAYAGFAFTGASILLLGAAFVVAGLGIGLVETAEHAAVAAYAPDEIRGSAFGLLAAIQSFGNLAASAVVGLLYTLASPQAAFGYASVVMVVALASLITTTRGIPGSRRSRSAP